MSYSVAHARKRFKRSHDDYYAAPLVSYKRARVSAPAPAEAVMARGRTRTAVRRRSLVRRRTRRYRRVPRTLTPFSLVRKLKTVFTYPLDPGAAGAISAATVKLSSAFDPAGGFGAGQPLGFDQYSTLYNRYAVIGWSVKIELVTTDNTNPTMVGFTPIVSSTTLTSFEHYKEVPGTVSMVLTPDIDKGTLFARGGVKRFLLGRGGKMLADDTVTAAVTADPTRMLHGHFWAQSVDAASDAAIVRAVVTLWQTVVFFVPVIPSRS